MEDDDGNAFVENICIKGGYKPIAPFFYIK
jgi:hypothetical protein